MQKVQNMAAKVVLNLRRHDSNTDAIKTLHWLPIRQQIEYKTINLTQQCIPGHVPNYLKKLLEIHTPHQAGLRSSSTAHKLDPKSEIYWEKDIHRQVIHHHHTQIMEQFIIIIGGFCL